MEELSSCQSPKLADEHEAWWESLTLGQKIAEFQRWLTCPCDACLILREIIGEERIRNTIEKAKERIERE